MERDVQRKACGGMVCPLGLLAACAVLATGSSVFAQCGESVLRNDTCDGCAGFACPCFVANEEAAGIFTAAPELYPIEVLRVQIFWETFFPPAPPSVEDSIRIYTGTPPSPTLIFVADGAPQLSAGFLNEFDLEPEPGQIIIDSGPFMASLRFFEDQDITSPSVVNDGDGCDVGKNAVFAIPGGWVDACSLGISGNWIIRVVIQPADCVPGTGACCLTDSGMCIDDQTMVACESAGGVYQGDDVVCGPGTCPQPDQACCFIPSGCLDLSALDCTSVGGFPQGAGTECGVTPCFPEGACCIDDGCMEKSEEDCIMAGGTYEGDLTTCGPDVCQPPTGACCSASGGCLLLTEEDCAVVPNSVYAGDDTACGGSTCTGLFDGACCFPAGGCLLLSSASCGMIAGTEFQGFGTTCTPGVCDSGDTGSCCHAMGGSRVCTDGVTAEECANDFCNSTFNGLGSSCGSTDCSVTCGMGDFDEDGDVDLPDFGNFQLCFGPSPSTDCQCAFDSDEDGDVDLTDFGQFQLNFTGSCG